MRQRFRSTDKDVVNNAQTRDRDFTALIKLDLEEPVWPLQEGKKRLSA
jgi:hypothetical protein